MAACAMAPNKAYEKVSPESQNQLRSVITSAKVKSIRMFVDDLMIQSKIITPSREISLAYTNMQRGFMWLGKVLQELNESNPYPESTNIASPKIEERTDQAKDSQTSFEQFRFEVSDRTKAIKWFRDKLDFVINQIVCFESNGRAADNAGDAFAEAKMWFGQELNNIRLSETK